MAAPLRPGSGHLRRCCHAVSATRRLRPHLPLLPRHHRTFHPSPPALTDGVFRELTEVRVQKPWIEAFRQKEAEEKGKQQSEEVPSTPKERELKPKRMSDSYHSVILPLARDPWLLDTYMNATGHIRLGTIFMDLDALSGVVAYKHTGDDVTTVTAACDRIIIKHPLTEVCDLQLSGQVTYATGRSSMEVSLQVAKAPEEGKQVQEEDILLECTFTMVSLDPKTKKPVNINPLIVETPEEKRLYQIGEENSKHRKEESKTSLMKQTPNDLESDLIHAMWQRQLQYHDPNDSLQKPDNVLFMDQTVLRAASIMQPQYRNRHHFMIFGGFLLKQSFELAFCCAASFSHARPTFVSLDPSTFQNPVPVGSILYMTATVVYTDPPLVYPQGEEQSLGENDHTRVQVRVDTKVRDVEHGEVKPTGEFHYTFNVDKDIRVMPRSYSEFMMYLDARRRAKRIATILQGSKTEVGKALKPGSAESITE